ncbi:glucosamine inositolphosphorylceramide transferase family protein [Gluconobacter morbifer]|uniref:Glucosamine inositolphosphorylceramide transferase 1 N-terminal domain-containing protein n=1 Tax=Gluconobacter morbifer G707 TaxID=1088869 RepID=G6XGZ0_9PROT|nr:hypothetical protein [Gluconobacter morbifer]EHH69448.1 hypothetical protein GMO_07550 [Gluconobacter morbifer G707]
MPFLRTDHWRSAIIHAPLAELVRSGSLNGHPVTLLPDIGDHRFLADPFGLWRDGQLYVFAEAYDYRQPHGVIEVLAYDRTGHLVQRETVLKEDWHLSYPYVFEHEGETYLLPEASESGRLSLYRSVAFPWGWEKVDAFDFPIGAIDATPFHHAGRWWMFWTPPGSRDERQSMLHISVADSLFGLWQDMGLFLKDRQGARPGGTPVVVEGEIFLPTQDCQGTYGRAIRLLKIEGLERGLPKVTPDLMLQSPAVFRRHYPDGMHTLSAAGQVTLIDVKKVGLGPKRDLFNLRRKLGVGV